jgi:tetratricopeptide (TPR) repeat protein
MAASSEIPAADALNPDAWVKWLCARATQEAALRSIPVIVHGLNLLKQVQPPPEIQPEHRSLFSCLSGDLENAGFLSEIAKLYLQDWKLPQIAKEHGELALQLLPGDEGLSKIVLQASAQAAEEQLKKEPLSRLIAEGISTKPRVSSLFKQTGKLVRDDAEPLAHKPVQNTQSLPGHPSSTSFDELLEKAASAYEEGKVEDAEKYYKRILMLKPQPDLAWEAWTMLGTLRFQNNDLEGSEEAYRQAREQKPDDFPSSFNLGVTLQAMGRTEEARDQYLEALRIDPDHPKALCNLGVIYFQMDDCAESEKQLRHCLEAKPDYARAWNNLGATLGALDRYEEACEACLRAIELQPTLADAWMKLGVLYFNHEDYPKAEEAFEKAPAMPFVPCYRSMISSRQGRMEDAAHYAEEAAESNATGPVAWLMWNELNLAYQQKEQFQKAVEAGQEALRLRPGEFEAHYNLAVALQRANFLSDAENHYREAINLNPDAARAWQNLAIVLHGLDRKEEAFRTCYKIIEIFPESSSAWHNIAEFLSSIGKDKEAAEALEEAAKYPPDQTLPEITLDHPHHEGTWVKLNSFFSRGKKSKKEED